MTARDPERDAAVTEEEARVAALLRLARRVATPAEASAPARARVYRATEEAWRREIGRRRARRRLAVGLALAAVVVVALLAPTLAELLSRHGTTPARVLPTAARLERAVGGVRLAGSPETAAKPLSIGEAVPALAVVATGADGRALLALDSGVRLRLDHDSAVRLRHARALDLLAGAVYVEAEGVGSAPAFTVFTPEGAVRDLGTRFEVRLAGGAVVVRVRSGLVAAAGRRLATGAELRIAKGALASGALPPWDAAWRWTQEVAPSLDWDGRALGELLAWVAGEEGRVLAFEPPSLGERVQEIRVHGSLAGLLPGEALAAVLPIAGLESRLERGLLVVRRAAKGARP